MGDGFPHHMAKARELFVDLYDTHVNVGKIGANASVSIS
jgi:hypothetical protein